MPRTGRERSQRISPLEHSSESWWKSLNGETLILRISKTTSSSIRAGTVPFSTGVVTNIPPLRLSFKFKTWRPRWRALVKLKGSTMGSRLYYGGRSMRAASVTIKSQGPGLKASHQLLSQAEWLLIKALQKGRSWEMSLQQLARQHSVLSMPPQSSYRSKLTRASYRVFWKRVWGQVILGLYWSLERFTQSHVITLRVNASLLSG
jgi:hypothetical protein